MCGLRRGAWRSQKVREGDRSSHENLRVGLNGAISSGPFYALRLCHCGHELWSARVSDSNAAGGGGHERESSLQDNALEGLRPSCG